MKKLKLILIISMSLMMVSCISMPKENIIVPCDTKLYKLDSINNSISLANVNISNCDTFLICYNSEKFWKYDNYSSYDKYFKIKYNNMEYLVKEDEVELLSEIDSKNGASESSDSHSYKTGKRGGQYYINSKGNKTYKKK